MPGMNSSQTPLSSRRRIAWPTPFHSLKSPTTRAAFACGAQTENEVPGDALVRTEVRAEHVPELLVPALAPEVEVDLADARARSGTGRPRSRPGRSRSAVSTVYAWPGAGAKPCQSPSATCSSSMRVPSARIAVTPSASGRTTRITNPPSIGCCPSASWGRGCEPPTSAAMWSGCRSGTLLERAEAGRGATVRPGHRPRPRPDRLRGARWRAVCRCGRGLGSVLRVLGGGQLG